MQYKGKSYSERHDEQGTTKKTKGIGFKITIAVILILLLLAGGAAAYVFLIYDDGGYGPLSILDKEKEPPVAYFATDEIKAFSADAPAEATNSAQIEEYFAPIFEFAKANGLNTMVLNSKNGIEVFWRDSNFPSYSNISANDKLLDRNRFDPLAEICSMAAENGIQVWLAADPYAAGNNGENINKPVGKLSEAGNDYFNADNKDYNELLVESFYKLPENYGVAGIVLTGLENVPDKSEQSTIKNENFRSAVEKIKENWKDDNFETKIIFSFKSSRDLTLSANDKEFFANNVDFVLPSINAALNVESNLELIGSVSPFVAVQAQEDTFGTVLFTATGVKNYAGAYFGSYSNLSSDVFKFTALKSLVEKEDSFLPKGFDVPKYLEITYPATGRLTYEGVYITGTSNPEEALYLDGNEIGSRAKNGAFGVFVPLEMGENIFTFTNGNETQVKEIERYEPTPQGGGSATKSDGSKEAEPGQAIVINKNYSNIISDPEDDYSISEIYNKGAVAIVTESIQVRGGTAWAYKLASGHYILGKNCAFTSGSGKSEFTGLSSQEHEKGEYIIFEGSGTPGAYISWLEEENTLRLTMYDTVFNLNEGFSSKLVNNARVETNDEGAAVLFLQTENLWGYNIEYEEGQTKLFLKEAPKINPDSDKPLTGVHVLLDPGHGEAGEYVNYGAVGLAGENGYPHEKDINLALGQMIAYRLEQLGAEVTFTKEDNSNPGINDRYLMQIEQKPDFFLSIHHDGLDGNMDLTGKDNIFGIYYHPYNTPPSKGFAQNLMDSVSEATGRTAEEKPRWGGINYGVIRTTICPSVLFEYGLIVTPEHFESTTSTDGMYASALATVQAIIDTIPE